MHYDNFADFFVEINTFRPEPPESLDKKLKANKFNKKDNTIECWYCDGTTVAYRDEDRDCIEGWKMADKHPCRDCGATGRVSSTALRKQHQNEVLIFNKRAEDYNRFLKFLEPLKLRAPGLRKKYGLDKWPKMLEKLPV